jgi:hypothetical protein
MPRIRKWGNGAFVRIVNLLFSATFTDLCYGYHAFWRYCLDSIDLEDVDGFEIDTALYLRALHERLRITEVPSFEGYRFYGIGKLQTIPDGWRVLRTILGEWWASLRTPQKNGHLGFRGSVPSGAEALQQAQAFLASVQERDDLYGRIQAGRRASTPTPSGAGDEMARLNLQLLHSACRLLAVQLNIRQAIETLLQLTLESLDAASGSVVLLDEHGEVIDGLLAYDGEIRPLPASASTDTVREGLAGWVIEHQQPALVSNTYADPRWLCRSWELSEGLSRSALGVPLVAEDRIVGVLTLVRPEAGQFSEADLHALSSVTMPEPAWDASRGVSFSRPYLPHIGNGRRHGFGLTRSN